MNASQSPLIAIACGGTGGHLFPGMAVGEELRRRGCRVLLIVSEKEVDQRAVRDVTGMEVMTLPSVGLAGRRYLRFAVGFVRAWRGARRRFAREAPAAVLAMGGFTSAPPVLAGRALGARTFLHEANTIPGRANRWLSKRVDEIFVWFREAERRFNRANVVATGMPVRPGFAGLDAAACRAAFGLDPKRPVLLIMGGSQGARSVNRLVAGALPGLARKHPELQYLHLTGGVSFEETRKACEAAGVDAVVRDFCGDMPRALGAATLALARAGASSIAELAAARVPSILVPYPHAADKHQFFNAGALVATGSARMLEEDKTDPEGLAEMVSELLEDPESLRRMKQTLEQWDHPRAAVRMAECILAGIGRTEPAVAIEPAPAGANEARHAPRGSDRRAAPFALEPIAERRVPQGAGLGTKRENTPAAPLLALEPAR